MKFQFCGFADEAGKTLKEQIDATRRLGWNAIEIRGVEGTNFVDLTDEQFDAAWKTLQENGIKIPSYGGQIANWARPITTDFEVDVAELKKAIPRMRKTNTKIIRCMSYPNADWSTDNWKKEVFRRLRELAKIAEDGGVILGHENCSGYGGEGPDEALELLAAVGSEAFKFIFDTGNVVVHGGNSWEFYEAVKDQTVHIHIKDAKSGPDGEKAVCYPDEGESDIPRIMSDLKARGYDGYISIEPHMAAAVHEGKDVDNAAAAADIYVEYGKRIMAIAEKA